MKNIYILLTRSDTIVSRAILFCTGADYTHASLAYDGELNCLSSFARRDPRFALPAGLVRENICEGFYALHDGIPCMLLSLTVSDEAHRRIAERVESMLSVREEYGYSLLGLLTPTAPRCPHMGCALKYNPIEHSWDCPCHGSRFTGEGKLLDNPATGDLKRE